MTHEHLGDRQDALERRCRRNSIADWLVSVVALVVAAAAFAVTCEHGQRQASENCDRDTKFDSLANRVGAIKPFDAKPLTEAVAALDRRDDGFDKALNHYWSVRDADALEFGERLRGHDAAISSSYRNFGVAWQLFDDDNDRLNELAKMLASLYNHDRIDHAKPCRSHPSTARN